MSSAVQVYQCDEYSIPPELAGRFCYPLEGIAVYKLNLVQFYLFGKEMRSLPSASERPASAFSRLENKNKWLTKFLAEIQNIPCLKTRNAAQELLTFIADVQRRAEASMVSTASILDWKVLTFEDQQKMRAFLEVFEREFDRESHTILSVFAVTPKGDKDTQILIERAEAKFPDHLLPVFPPKSIQDIQEAGRCLAFDRPTACAFHVCRATEGLMRAYYKKLTTYDWPPPPPKPKMSKDWKVLVDQLRVEGAPPYVWQRLEEIREDRNSFAHPDVTVAPHDAVVVYDLCTNVMQLMAEEIIK